MMATWRRKGPLQAPMGADLHCQTALRAKRSWLMLLSRGTETKPDETSDETSDETRLSDETLLAPVWGVRVAGTAGRRARRTCVDAPAIHEYSMGIWGRNRATDGNKLIQTRRTQRTEVRYSCNCYTAVSQL